MRWQITAWAVLLAAGLLPASVHGQTLLARTVDANTSQPLQGALVVVVDPAGEHVASALTDPRGQYLFAGLPVGTYTVRAELIGFATATQTVTVALGPTPTVEFRLESSAIELEGLSVEGEARCTLRPQAGFQVADVWDEVRKALEAARWTDEHGVYEYRTRRYSRDIEEATGLVSNQQSRRGRVFVRAPYESRPVEDLLENGFVQKPEGGGGDLYFGPDASVLLADAFLDSHCMRLRAGDGDEVGLVGLAFEPVRGRRIADISGTLWLDPATWRLSHLEYRYENTGTDVETRGIGGEIAFQQLPNGTWIIPEWRIRTPWLALGRDIEGRETIFQYGHHEEGAVVLSVREPGGEVIFSASTAALEGIVVEEATADPVDGAVVWLMGTDERTTADTDGRFRFTEMPPGGYEVAVSHPLTQAYGPASTPVPVELRGGNATSVMVVVSNPFAFHEAVCRQQEGYDERPAGTALLVGRVLDAGTGDALGGARVVVDWDDFSTIEVQARIQVLSVATTTGSDGLYRACMVPANARVRVGVEWRNLSTEPDTIRMPDGATGFGHDVRVRGVG